LDETLLRGRVIAVPEARELDVFASLLERRGATTIRCPLVRICDAPDPQPVIAWARAFSQGSCDDLILYTGEGLRRLLSCIDANAPEIREPFIAALARVRKIVRGPKPARELRALKLKPDIEAVAPTTAGILTTLRELDLEGRRIGVQLYGTDPIPELTNYLLAQGARVLPVAPYVYADAASDAAIELLLDRIDAGQVDAIAFTSASQVQRLVDLAGADRLTVTLRHTLVAAVGPIVAQALQSRGIDVAVVPETQYFMKPLVALLEQRLGASAA
jgi:uroporphyrinogen-III synthase